jgi:hypothetical protein
MGKPVASAFPFTDDEIVVAFESFSAHPHFNVQAGARVRASAEIVQRYPEHFCKDGLSDEEKRQLIERLHPTMEATQHVPTTALPQPIVDEDAVICISRVPGGGGHDAHGRNLAVEKGARVSKRDTRIQDYLDHFVPVVPHPGMTRENSVRALTDHFEYRRGADGEFIRETDMTKVMQSGEYKHFPVFYRGQWVSRDRPEVREHPTWFEGIY